MEFQAFVHGVFASTQSAPSDRAGCSQHSNFGNTAFKSKLAAKVAFYTAIAVAAIIGGSFTGAAFAAGYNNNASASTSDLQSLLASRGFYKGEIDGIEGAGTKQAVVKAQQFYGLTTDGIVGNTTLLALNEDKADSSKAAIAANISVSDLQILLAKRGFYKGSADGILGPSTKAAIIQAQKFYGLNPDGVVGNRTVAALEADTNTPQTTSNLTGDDIVRLQKLLTSRGFYSGPISGYVGNQTKDAILKAQKFYGLKEDGIPGTSTFKALEADSEFKKTAKTDDIRNVQSLLTERGFYKGEIDGVLGDGTKEAIRAAQRAYGLKVDGVVGPSTLSALTSKSGRVSATSTKSTTASTTKTARTMPVSEKPAAKSHPVTRVAAKPTPAKPEISKTAVAKTPSTVAKADRPIEKPVASQVTVKPTKTVAKSATPTPAAPTEKPAEKPVAAKPAPSKEAPKQVLDAKPTPADMPSVENPETIQPTASPDPVKSAAVTQPIQKAPASPTSVEPSSPVSTHPVSTKPATNNNVQISQLQNLLSTRGFFTGSSTGVMDTETKNAIVRAQSFYGLTPTDGDPSATLVESLNRDPFVAKDN